MKIILIGMMGSGKSAVAKRLAELTNTAYFELDEIFEKKYFKIADFFKEKGEAEFRLIETQILIDTLKNDDYIISTGGGVILKKENRDLFFASADKDVKTFYLKTAAETIYNRIKNDRNRPLLLVQNPKEEIKKILNSREKYYAQAAFDIETDLKTVDEIAKEILEKL